MKASSIKISHLGAKDCVTGSCHLIETHPGSADADGINILVDCGKAQGSDPELPFSQFPVPPEKIDYLFLTHAHIDHIGRVPELTSYSAHADQRMLVNWVRSMSKPPKEIRLVHGEDEARRSLARVVGL